MRHLTHGAGQYGIRGRVINRPIQVQQTVQCLHRSAPNDVAIEVYLKRGRLAKPVYKYGLVTKSEVRAWLENLEDMPLCRFYISPFRHRFAMRNPDQYVETIQNRVPKKTDHVAPDAVRFFYSNKAVNSYTVELANSDAEAKIIALDVYRGRRDEEEYDQACHRVLVVLAKLRIAKMTSTEMEAYDAIFDEGGDDPQQGDTAAGIAVRRQVVEAMQSFAVQTDSTPCHPIICVLFSGGCAWGSAAEYASLAMTSSLPSWPVWARRHTNP
ncbi:hypothetical protein MTO96_036493 [Rhipicephalus appendiculatus]